MVYWLATSEILASYCCLVDNNSQYYKQAALPDSPCLGTFAELLQAYHLKFCCLTGLVE